MVTVIGIGTLLSEDSVNHTCPGAVNFRLGVVSGYKRVFNKVDPFAQDFKSLKRANLSAVRDASASIMVSAVDIVGEDWHAMLAREFDYDICSVEFYDQQVAGPVQAYICSAYENDEICEKAIRECPIRTKGLQKLRKKYDGPIWSTDLLPNPDYIFKCLRALSGYGQDFKDNFLDQTWLGCETRTLRSYLLENDM